ncbi:hypothetical protein [Nocardia ignorata]|uniref:Uncharacterized protein n=1 Tax=Nocardia ignorata TaxID=145285 RepID=A0A4R6NZT8_NOCIG|nr:hypothetical protein [Nocardia ignorata]TDP29858.1 hypothetical protein DFR75_112127 [Nocardia ignorata]
MTGPAENDDHGDVVPRTDRGLTEAGDAGHNAYVQAKLAEAATQLDKIRGPLDWQRQVELWGDRKLLHDMMMHGYQELHGRTPELGWVHEHPATTSLGARRHDAAQVVERAGIPVVQKTTEFKAGWASKKEGLEQLKKERELLRTDPNRKLSEYIIRAAHPPHPEVVKEARQLAQDFPGRFVHIELNEREFERAVEAGRPIVEKQLMHKLGHLVEKLRNAPELKTAPRALEGFVREIEMAKERGDPIGLEVLAGAQIELASLIEVDKQITREQDKIAREAAKLRLKEAQIVERVQAQQRAEREQQLLKLLEKVDREVVIAAVKEARTLAAPAKGLDLAVEPGMDPELAAMMQQMHGVIASQGLEARQSEMLEYLPMPTPRHRELAGLVLAQQAEQPGKPVTEAVAAAEEKLKEREAKELEQAKAVEAQQVRERENRELMERIVDAHNKRLEQAARDQGQRVTHDRMDDAAWKDRVPKIAESLKMDPQRLLERGVDPQVVDAIARGAFRTDDKARAVVVEINGAERWVANDSKEIAIATQIQQVQAGMNLGEVHVRALADAGGGRGAVALSREKLQKQREEAERRRVREAEQVPERTRSERGDRGTERGIERGR